MFSMSFASRMQLVIGHAEENRGNGPGGHHLRSLGDAGKPGSDGRWAAPGQSSRFGLHSFQERFFIVIVFLNGQMLWPPQFAGEHLVNTANSRAQPQSCARRSARVCRVKTCRVCLDGRAATVLEKVSSRV